MRRITVATISVAASLALAACAERDTTSPRAIAPGEANAANTPPTPTLTCDPNATKSAARTYFTSSQDAGIGYVNEMAKAIGSGDFATANTNAWAALQVVAVERLTSATKDGSWGSPLVIDILRCVSDLGASPVVGITVPADFVSKATLIVNSGLFDIRGTGADSSGPALGKVTDASTHVRAFGAPRWGVEAVSGTWFGIQHLVYGYPTAVGTPILGSNSINSNDALGGGPYNAFEIGTVPAEAHHPGLRVGTCVQANGTADGTAGRLVHNNNEILINDSPTQMCDPTLQALAPTSPTWYAAAIQRFSNFFSVTPAFAQDRDFVGGLPDGWSPFEYGNVTAAAVNESFVVAPANTTVKTTADDSIVVKASIGNVGVPGVTVSFSIAGNNGRPAGATFEDGSLTKTGVTGPGGLVTIKYGLGKPGGYTTTTTGTFDTFSINNSLIAALNVKNP